MKKQGKSSNKKVRNKIYKWSRVLHIYLSTSLFALMILFCVTGIVLNHVNWISGQNQDGAMEVELPQSVLKAVYANTEAEIFLAPPLNEIQAWLAREYSLKPVSDIELDEAAAEITFDYKIPGGYAAVVWVVSDTRATIDYRLGSFWTVMGDLHKGRHSGAAWSWVIDISAGLMVMFSITGMIILLQNNKHRRLGGVFMGLGLVTPLVIFLMWVPKLSGV